MSDGMSELLERGELRATAPGSWTLGPDANRAIHKLEGIFDRFSRRFGAPTSRVPPVLPVTVLERAGYYAQFPQHGTFAVPLVQDGERVGAFVRGVEHGESVTQLASHHLEPPTAALPSAVCFHCWAELQGAVLDGPGLVWSARGLCFRHERDWAPLSRQWAFRMHEIAFAASPASASAFRDRVQAAAVKLAGALGFETTVAVATDPFFGSDAGRAMKIKQQAGELKRELNVTVAGAELAIASFNLHGDHFVRAFDIRMDDGRELVTGCVAFGVERWLRALVAAHGPDPEVWERVLDGAE